MAQYLQSIKTYCFEAANDCVEKYTKTYLDMVRCGAVDEKDMLQLHAEVFTVEELMNRLEGIHPDLGSRLTDINETVKDQYIREGITIQQVSVEYIKHLITLYNSPNPVVVIGIAPPYYPAVTNDQNNPELERILDGLVSNLNSAGYAPAFRDPYNAGPTDLCYMFCNSAEKNMEIMRDMCIPKEIYDIDFMTLEKINIPAILIGATGKDVHKKTERVWLDDVDHKVPYILEEIIRLAFQ